MFPSASWEYTLVAPTVAAFLEKRGLPFEMEPFMTYAKTTSERNNFFPWLTCCWIAATAALVWVIKLLTWWSLISASSYF